MAESHVYATVHAFVIHYYYKPWHPHKQNEQRVGVSYKFRMIIKLIYHNLLSANINRQKIIRRISTDNDRQAAHLLKRTRRKRRWRHRPGRPGFLVPRCHMTPGAASDTGRLSSRCWNIKHSPCTYMHAFYLQHPYMMGEFSRVDVEYCSTCLRTLIRKQTPASFCRCLRDILAGFTYRV